MHFQDYDYFLISGRSSRCLIEQKLLDFDYDKYFCEIVAPKRTSKLTTEEFKEKLCKAFDIDLFFDDNNYTVYYLRKKGIDAIKV